MKILPPEHGKSSKAISSTATSASNTLFWLSKPILLVTNWMFRCVLSGKFTHPYNHSQLDVWFCHHSNWLCPSGSWAITDKPSDWIKVKSFSVMMWQQNPRLWPTPVVTLGVVNTAISPLTPSLPSTKKQCPEKENMPYKSAKFLRR